MHARIGRITFSPDKADDVTRYARETSVPRYEGVDGFKGFTLLLDRSRGEAVGVTFWESEEAMRATEGIADEIRRGAAEAGSGSDQGPEYFEVPIDTMA